MGHSDVKGGDRPPFRSVYPTANVKVSLHIEASFALHLIYNVASSPVPSAVQYIRRSLCSYTAFLSAFLCGPLKQRGSMPYSMKLTALLLGVGATLVRGQAVMYAFPLASRWQTLQKVRDPPIYI